MTGYTDKQAATLHLRIERRVARIEDSLAALAAAVPDTSVRVVGTTHAPSTEQLAEHAREIGHFLHDAVDRRRR